MAVENRGEGVCFDLLIHSHPLYGCLSSIFRVPSESKNCLFLLCNQAADKSWPRNFKEGLLTLFQLEGKGFPAMVLDLSSNVPGTIYLATLSTHHCLTKEHLCTQEGRCGGGWLMIKMGLESVAEAQGRSGVVCVNLRTM